WYCSKQAYCQAVPSSIRAQMLVGATGQSSASVRESPLARRVFSQPDRPSSEIRPVRNVSMPPTESAETGNQRGARWSTRILETRPPEEAADDLLGVEILGRDLPRRAGVALVVALDGVDRREHVGHRPEREQ